MYVCMYVCIYIYTDTYTPTHVIFLDVIFEASSLWADTWSRDLSQAWLCIFWPRALGFEGLGFRVTCTPKKIRGMTAC